MYPGVDLRFVFLDPLVFPQGILDAGGSGPGAPQAAQKHEGIYAGDGDAVRLTGGKLLAAPLVHIAHGPAQGTACLIHQHQALHL